MTISLRDLSFRAYHGCLPQEQTVGGDFLVSVSLDLPATAAATERDELSGTVDYASLYALVRDEMRVPSRLLEHICGRIGRRVLQVFPEVTAVEVSVTKCAPPIAGFCGGGATVSLRTERSA